MNIYCVDLDIFQTVTNIISHFMVIYLYTVSFLPYSWDIQGDSVARGPKLLSIKNYVIEIMT